MGRCTLHWYAMMGMWLGRVTLLGYSSALGVVSTAKIAVPFVLLYLFMTMAYVTYIWHTIIETIIATKKTCLGSWWAHDWPHRGAHNGPIAGL
jgi:hypothetical protein